MRTKRNNKRLYESIMKDVSKTVKKQLNEEESYASRRRQFNEWMEDLYNGSGNLSQEILDLIWNKRDENITGYDLAHIFFEYFKNK